MRRATLVVLSAVLFALAGCGALAGGGSDPGTRTVTPVSIQTTETTPAPTTVAPGLAADRVVDYAALVDRHAAVIANSSHTYHKRVTRRYPNGSVWRAYTTDVQRNGSAVRYQYNWSSGDGARQTVDRWQPGDRTYVARTDGNETSVTVANGTAAGGAVLGTTGGYASSLDRFLALLDVTVTGTEYRDGRRLYRLETPEPVELSPSRNVTFVGYVTPEGVFTDYRLTYRIVRRSVRIDVTVDASFEGIGSTTVERPVWADRIPNGTAPE